MSKTDAYVDYKGWRFRPPFRCMCCGRRISIQQFCFARCCGGCDVNRRNPSGGRGCYSGPRELRDRNDKYFIAEDKWDNPVEGLPLHQADSSFEEVESRLRRAVGAKLDHPRPMEVKEAIKVGIDLSCAVEHATRALEGLMPLIKTKVDIDLFTLIDETIQRNLMAVASFDAYMRGNFKDAVDGLVGTTEQTWVPKEIRLAGGPQPEEFGTWDEWVNARRLWVAKNMMPDK